MWSIDYFDVEKKLGNGQYAKVYLARETVIHKTVALKVISKKIFGKKITDDQLLKEIEIQFKLKHDNIVKLFGHFEDDKARYIVLEYCEHGDLYKDILTCKGYSNERAATYIYQLAHALDYCFSNGVIHRDIKAENILISASGAVKIADFGWSAKFKNKDRVTYCGTLEYMSPDIISGDCQNEKVDIWCLGVLLYEMLNTKTPFYNENQAVIFNNIKYIKYTVPPHIDLFAKYLIINILRKNIFERLTAKQIILHPFVVKFAEKTLKECKAAHEQWLNLNNFEMETSNDPWSSVVKCPTVDFAKECQDNNDIDINFEDSDADNGSYCLLKEKAKKDAAKNVLGQ